MTIKELKLVCMAIEGIDKVRIAKLGDGCFLKFKEVWTGSSFWQPHTFVFLDGWQKSLEMAIIEYGKFYKP